MLEQGPVFLFVFSERLLGPLAVGDVDEALQEMLPAVEEYGRHGFQDGEDFPGPDQEFPFGVVDLFPQVGDGAAPLFVGADKVVACPSHDLLCREAEHGGREGVGLNHGVAFGIDDEDAYVEGIQDRPEPGFAFPCRALGPGPLLHFPPEPGVGLLQFPGALPDGFFEFFGVTGRILKETDLVESRGQDRGQGFQEVRVLGEIPLLLRAQADDADDLLLHAQRQGGVGMDARLFAFRVGAARVLVDIQGKEGAAAQGAEAAEAFPRLVGQVLGLWKVQARRVQPPGDHVLSFHEVQHRQVGREGFDNALERGFDHALRGGSGVHLLTDSVQGGQFSDEFFGGTRGHGRFSTGEYGKGTLGRIAIMSQKGQQHWKRVDGCRLPRGGLTPPRRFPLGLLTVFSLQGPGVAVNK